MQKAETIDHILAARVAPVVRTSSAELAARAVEVLAAEGLSLFEITLTIPGAMALIGTLVKNTELCIGVGTVLSADQGRQAIEAGASFVVSPAFVPGLVEAAPEVPVALGAATPTEALRAQEAGADFVKVFPAAQLGGPGFVKALRSVYPGMRIMPTGGIGPADIPAYLNAGAACLGMGGNLVNEAGLKAGEDQVIRAAAREVLARVEAAE
ncbi:MAG: bifunctional 4-hydroxy-2-oxoglutarate aldolase/2-dehydro-3-deoxy-phosphogluconate aldolase [Pseudomonadota bacterium]